VRIEKALAAVAVVLLTATSSAGAAQSAGPVTIRYAWNIPAGDAPLALFGKPGIAKHEGISYHFEFSHTTGTPPMVAALAGNEVDIASLSFSTFPLVIESSKLDDLRIIADVLQDGVAGYYSNEFMVLKEGPIKRIEDMKGKTASSNAIGSALDMGIRLMLRQHGLEDKRDYSLIESTFPNMKSMLLGHQADLISSVTPFSQDPSLRAVTHTLFTQHDAMGTSQLLVMVARAGFLAKNRAAMVDFLEDNLREQRWYLDPAHHDEAIKAVADFTKTPPGTWSSWLFTGHDLYRAPDGKPNLAAMKRNIETTYALKFLPAPLDPAKYADLSLVEEAAKRLK
jgi:ABC-type nitrate/sulfonate/bicarbonate transport system substrate-binding protein